MAQTVRSASAAKHHATSNRSLDEAKIDGMNSLSFRSPRPRSAQLGPLPFPSWFVVSFEACAFVLRHTAGIPGLRVRGLHRSGSWVMARFCYQPFHLTFVVQAQASAAPLALVFADVSVIQTPGPQIFTGDSTTL